MRFLKKLLLVSVIIIGIHIIIISINGITNTQSIAQTAIVLGNKVQNGKPSSRLKARLDTAHNLYQNKQTQQIFVSGGLGKEGYLEAEIMAKYLIDQGIPKENIIVDNQGNNTKLTAKNASKALDTTIPVIVVSQFFHITRSELYLKKYGFQKVYSASLNYFELRDIYSLLREIPALYVAWFT